MNSMELTENAGTNAWTLNNYRQYTRIRHELKECKRVHNNKWEEKVDIIEISKDTKTWNTIKQLKGNNTTHTNYLQDNDGNRYYTDAEKCSHEKYMEKHL